MRPLIQLSTILCCEKYNTNQPDIVLKHHIFDDYDLVTADGYHASHNHMRKLW